MTAIKVFFSQWVWILLDKLLLHSNHRKVTFYPFPKQKPTKWNLPLQPSSCPKIEKQSKVTRHLDYPNNYNFHCYGVFAAPGIFIMIKVMNGC